MTCGLCKIGVTCRSLQEALCAVCRTAAIHRNISVNPLSAEAYLKELIPLLIDLNPKISAVSKALEKRDE